MRRRVRGGGGGLRFPSEWPGATLAAGIRQGKPRYPIAGISGPMARGGRPDGRDDGDVGGGSPSPGGGALGHLIVHAEGRPRATRWMVGAAVVGAGSPSAALAVAGGGHHVSGSSPSVVGPGVARSS